MWHSKSIIPGYQAAQKATFQASIFNDGHLTKSF